MRLFHGPIGERLDERLTLIHPDDRARVTEARDRNMAAGIPFSVDLRLRRQDGAHRWHMLSMVPLQRGGRTVEWVGTSLDIDNMRRAEDRCAAARSGSPSPSKLPGGLWDWNVPTGALYMSDRGYAMLGSSPGRSSRTSPPGRPWSTTTSPRRSRAPGHSTEAARSTSGVPHPAP
jgi:PAS domain-containing protein